MRRIYLFSSTHIFALCIFPVRQVTSDLKYSRNNGTNDTDYAVNKNWTTTEIQFYTKTNYCGMHVYITSI